MELRALYKVTYGMYVISSKKGEKLNGQIANTLFQITSAPPIVAVSINKENLTHEFIKASNVFGVSILSVDTPMKLIGHFGFKSGREVNKFKGVPYKIGKTGVPILKKWVLAFLEAEVINSVDSGTHTIFIGKLVNSGLIEDGASEPMTYAYYHEIKGGNSSKQAPTYVEEKIKKEESGVKKYKCKVCGYVYDPQKGDPDAGIKPGTSFEDLPDDWVCPVCGVGKEEFEEE